MVFMTVPKLGLANRLKESIPIIMDEATALDRLYQGMITLKPGEVYTENIYRAAELYS